MTGKAVAEDREIQGAPSKEQYFIHEVIDALQSIGTDPAIVTSLAWGILGYYQQPWRKYHTVDHVMDMIEKAKELNWYTPCEMRLAIIYHDICMNPPGKQPVEGHNEAMSALMMRRSLERRAVGLTSEEGSLVPSYYRKKMFCVSVETIEDMILMTGNYARTDIELIQPWSISDGDPREDYELRFQARLCDLDLSSLAREPYEAFLQQQRNIIEEAGYSTEDGDFAYIEGMRKCAKFLKKTFLKNRGDALYYTKEGRERWLQKAKDNMKRFCKEYGDEYVISAPKAEEVSM